MHPAARPRPGTPVPPAGGPLAANRTWTDISYVHVRRPSSMSVPSTVRVRRSRLRRTSAALLLASGLSVSGTAVVSAGAPSSSHLPAPSSVNVVGLKYGAYGDNVRALQNALNRVGIGVKYGVDGYFGSATRASVKAFQNYKGLPVTGEVDPATAAALGFSVGSTQATAVAAATSATSAATSATSTAVGLQIGARGPAVVALQRAIISMGWTIAGGADGVFGAATRAALIRAQKANGVPGTGVVNEATARLFNLTSTPNTATTAQPAAGGS